MCQTYHSCEKLKSLRWNQVLSQHSLNLKYVQNNWWSMLLSLNMFHSKVKFKSSSFIVDSLSTSRSSWVKSWTFSFWDSSILSNKLHRWNCLSSITFSMSKLMHMMLYVMMNLVCMICYILFFAWFCMLIIHFEFNCTK